MNSIPSLRRLRTLHISNVFLLRDSAGAPWLIDTGHRLERRPLLLELERRQIPPAELRGILLTHRHSDHAGNASFLQREFGVPVAAHRADAEILAGEVPLPLLTRRGGARVAAVLARVENRWPSKLVVEHALEHGDKIAGLEVHWAPGHTPGSVFYREPVTRSLVTGDMLLTRKPPLVYRSGLSLPYPTFSNDMAQVYRTLVNFHEEGVAYDNLLPGHGPTLVGHARAKIMGLLRENGLIGQNRL